MALWRLLRCNPWSKGGYDPVRRAMITYLIIWEQIQGVLEWLLNTYFGWVGNWGWAIVMRDRHRAARDASR